MSVRGRGWAPGSKDAPRPFCSCSFPRRILPFILVVVFSNVTSVTCQGSFFRSLLGVPDHCSNDGAGFTSCTFLLTCYYERGTPLNPCGGGILYTCCDQPVATVRSDISNDISPFNLFREQADLRSKLPMFSRGRSPSERLPLSQLRIPFQPNLIRVREEPLFPGNFPSKPLFTSREEMRIGLAMSPEKFYNEPECGVQQTHQFSKRIIGGDEAGFGELPWQVHIRISGYQCGGVLLNRLFVATAAHCVHKARLNQITIHLGEYDTKDTGRYYEPFPKETFTAVEKRTHPRFKYMLTQPDRFDVAVLRLSHPVTYRPNIVPICLPSSADDFEGSVGVVAGWGKTDTSFGKTGTNILRKVTVPVINNRECLRWHHLKGIDVKLHYEMFCAGHSDGEMDACLGDSGGPLVIHHRGKWRLAGITSAGFGCAVDHQPGIYHKVSVTAGWIAANIMP